jgi:thiol-disulfide isomerase/thioredoxin
MRIKILFLTVLILSAVISEAKQVEPLQIGDKLPLLNKCEFLNKPGLHGFPQPKKKLLILDFWTIYCKTCIEKMPEMEALQKQFDNDLDIVLVTVNKKGDVEKLFTRIKKNVPDLPMVINDTMISRLFPHQSVPHHVWIDSDGIVKYISYGYNTNADNIRSVLGGKKIRIALKQEITDFNRSKPLWLEGRGRLSHHLKYYSLLMERIDEVGSSSSSEKADSAKNTVELKIINSTVLGLYRVAVNGSVAGGIFSSNNRTLLEVNRPDELFPPSDPELMDSWKKNNVYSYEASVPSVCRDDVYEVLLDDLNRLFPYSGGIEKRKVQCLVIIQLDSSKKKYTTGLKPVRRLTEKELVIQNMPFQSSVVNDLVYANRNLITPVIDGTHYAGNIDIHIEVPLTNIPGVKSCLRNYGFDLVEKEMEIDMLVIKDNMPKR